MKEQTRRRCLGCGSTRLIGRAKFCTDCRPRTSWKHVLREGGEAMVWVEKTTEDQNGVAPQGRDLFYFLVSIGQIPNDESAYNGLMRHSAQLRDQGDFPDLDDPTREVAH